MMKEDFSNKLRKLMNKRKLTAKEIAQKLDVAVSTVTHWSNGTRKFPQDLNKLYTLAKLLNVSILDLLPNSDEEKYKITIHELSTNPTKYNNFFKDKLPPSVKAVPLINGYVGAGSGGIIDNIAIKETIYIDTNIIQKAYRNDKLKALTIIGDSMEPYVSNGDIVIYKELYQENLRKIDGKYIINLDGELMLKNLKFLLNGNIRIISENPSYHSKDGFDEELDKDTQQYLQIIGIVVGRILKN